MSDNLDNNVDKSVDEAFKKIISNIEKSVKDEEEFYNIKSQLDNLIKMIAGNYDVLLKKYDEKLDDIIHDQFIDRKRIEDLEEQVEYFEKLIEMEDYDIFITCPYCGYEFQTEYDENITEIPCPQCGRLIEVDWSDDDDERNDDSSN